MSFRKNNKQERDESLKWNHFCEANRELIERIGLSTPTIETEERFVDFLMHGYIDHHDDWSNFDIGQLPPEKRELFKVLIDSYLAAGFMAPSLQGVISPAEEKSLVLKYPKQFHHSFVKAYDDLENEDRN